MEGVREVQEEQTYVFYRLIHAVLWKKHKIVKQLSASWEEEILETTIEIKIWTEIIQNIRLEVVSGIRLDPLAKNISCS